MMVSISMNRLSFLLCYQKNYVVDLVWFYFPVDFLDIFFYWSFNLINLIFIGRSLKQKNLIAERIILLLRTEMGTRGLQIVLREYHIQRLVKFPLEVLAKKSPEPLLI